jgi:hypothetical protein
MSNKPIATVATMGIDIGKNSFHAAVLSLGPGTDSCSAVSARFFHYRGESEGSEFAHQGAAGDASVRLDAGRDDDLGGAPLAQNDPNADPSAMTTTRAMSALTIATMRISR